MTSAERNAFLAGPGGWSWPLDAIRRRRTPAESEAKHRFWRPGPSASRAHRRPRGGADVARGLVDGVAPCAVPDGEAGGPGLDGTGRQVAAAPPAWTRARRPTPAQRLPTAVGNSAEFAAVLSRNVADAPLSPEDAAVLARIETRSARVAGIAHLVTLLVLGGVALTTFLSDHGAHPAVVSALLLDLGASLFGTVFAQRQRPAAWLAWSAGLLDVAVLFGIVVETLRFEATLPAGATTALVGAWGVFLTLTLSTLRGRPALLGVQTLLFACGLGFAITRGLMDNLFEVGAPHALPVTFNPALNVIRLAVVVMAGTMLALTTLRGKANLRHAVSASRRAANLSRYFAPSVASVVADADLAGLREGRHQNVAVLFADIRGFTALSGSMAPRDIAAFLTAFRRRAAAAIEGEGGVIDKFIGDEVMGLFGVPTATSRDAGRAIRAAQTLLDSMRAWSAERAALGLPAVRVGIGIHYGPVFAGVLGDSRLEFTVLGNTVNIARRVEELTKSLNQDCIVTAWAIRAARAQGSFDVACRGYPAQTVRGSSEPVAVFALLDRSQPPAGPIESRAP